MSYFNPSLKLRSRSSFGLGLLHRLELSPVFNHSWEFHSICTQTSPLELVNFNFDPFIPTRKWWGVDIFRPRMIYRLCSDTGSLFCRFFPGWSFPVSTPSKTWTFLTRLKCTIRPMLFPAAPALRASPPQSRRVGRSHAYADRPVQLSKCKETIMADFPIWLKGIVWLIVGSTALYAAAQVLYSVLS